MLKFLKSSSAQSASFADTSSCAVVISEHGELTNISETAAPLVSAWKEKSPELMQLVSQVRSSGTVGEARLVRKDGTRYSLTAIARDKDLVVVARDTTVSDRMTQALLDSRSLFKGLLDRAVDLSFEVDRTRAFTFLSPSEIFGQPSDDWLGKKADDFFWPSGRLPARNPFSSRTATEYDAVAVNIDGNETGWVSFSVEPIWEGDMFMGVRGVCRDVSHQVADGRQTRMDNLRLGLQQRVINLLNTSHTSDELLDNASSELLEVLRAEQVWAIVRYPEGLVPAAVSGESTFLPNIDQIWQDLRETGEQIAEVQDGDFRHLVVRLEENEKGIGMLVMCRDTKNFPWSNQERALLEAIMDALAAAFGKAQLINRLERLSSIDELTGIMNRRAFVEFVERRLRHQRRSGQSGCLLFIDLDHFKEVNDSLGHGVGDQAIKLVADTMQTIIRACDEVGRYGGDEFVIWLEDIEPADAALKARVLIDSMPGIREKIGAENLRLSASVGVCASIPGIDLKFKDLSDRADEALYEVKKAGRSSVAMARMPSQEEIAAAGGSVAQGGVEC